MHASVTALVRINRYWSINGHCIPIQAEPCEQLFTFPFVLFQYDNRTALIQDLMLHDSISKRAAVLLQLSCGLSVNGVTEMIKLFPDLFSKFFVFEEEDDAEKFLGCLLLPGTMTTEEERTMGMFRKYIESCSSTGDAYVM